MKEVIRNISWKRYALNLGVLVAAVLAVIFSLILYLNKERELQVAEFAYQQQRNINRDANASREQLEQSIEFHKYLRSTGVVGEAERLQWIEITQTLSNTLGIPLVDFTLDSAEKLDLQQSPYFHEELELFVTPMSLEMDLRHEGEFFVFMEGLRMNAQGLFSVDDCELRRNAISEGANSEYSGFQSRCRLLWYSIVDVTRDWEVANQ